MRNHRFLFLFFLLLGRHAYAQVPAEEEAGAPLSPPPASEQPGDEGGPSFSTGILSDPEELALIEGLDDPFDVIKLRDHDANMILDLIQTITARYILRPQNLPAVKISFDSMSVLSKREALLALESLLSMNGIGITKIDGLFFKAVPAAGINTQVPIWLDGSAFDLSPSQRIYVKMFHLQYAPALEIQTQLTPFSTPSVGSLLVFEKANAILATDSLLNLQRIEKLLENIDRPIRPDELGVTIMEWDTKHAGAAELASKLKAMIEGSLKPFLGGTTQLDADERTSKLIIVTRMENEDILRHILGILDDPVKMKTTSRLFKLQHADAPDVQKILDEVIKKQLAVKEKLQGKNLAARAKATTQSNAPPTPGAASSQAPSSNTSSSDFTGNEGGNEFSDFITISSDERSNSILVYGTRSDIDEIGRMIEDLDHRLPLALIDTIFVMVDLTEDRQRGIDAFLGAGEWSKVGNNRRTVTSPGADGQLGTADDEQTTEFVTADKDTSTSLSLPGLGSTVNFEMLDWKLTGVSWNQLFARSSGRNDVRVFSTPSIMVSHNADSVEIKIEDERNYRVLTSYTDSSGRLQSGYDFRSVQAKTSLEVKKPKIGEAVFDDENDSLLVKPGSIFMEVEVKAEKFDETQVGDGEVPPKKIRAAKTLLSVADQEIVVLGGLQEVYLSKGEAKYNFLSDIPYLGEKFFTPKNVKYTPTELLIFLRPTIINPNDDPKVASRQNTEKIDLRMDGSFNPVFRSPSGKILGGEESSNSKKRNSSIQDEPSTKPKL